MFSLFSVYTPGVSYAEIVNSGIPKGDLLNSPIKPLTDLTEIIISKDNGSIKDTHMGENGHMIVHIQDAHVNYEGQKNLAHILNKLVEKHGIRLVLVEGGSDYVGLSLLRHFSTKKQREAIADRYLRNGRIAGEEYLDIVSDPGLKFDVYGIEDKRLYKSNLDQFIKIDKFSNGANDFISLLESSLKTLKNRFYSKELKGHEAKRIEYEEERLELVPYAQYLADKKKDLTQYSEIGALLKTYKLEEYIDFIEVNKERDDFITALSKELPKEKLNALLKKSVDFKANLISPKDFYLYIKDLGTDRDVDIRDYRNLNIYTYYIRLFEDIKREKLFSEIKSLESVIREGLCKNDTQRELGKVTNDLALINNFVSLRLSPNDLKEYKSRKKDFNTGKWIKFLNKTAKSKKLATAFVDYNPVIDINLKKLERFYETAGKRDNAFFKNAIELMKDKNEKRAVLITGGFHTESLMPMFRDEGYSYIVVSPNILYKTDLGLYHSLLKGELTQQEKAVQAAFGLLRIKALVDRIPTLELVARKIMGIEGGAVKAVGILEGLEEALKAHPGLKENLEKAIFDVDGQNRIVRATIGGNNYIYSIETGEWKEAGEVSAMAFGGETAAGKSLLAVGVPFSEYLDANKDMTPTEKHIAGLFYSVINERCRQTDGLVLVDKGIYIGRPEGATEPTSKTTMWTESFVNPKDGNGRPIKGKIGVKYYISPVFISNLAALWGAGNTSLVERIIDLAFEYHESNHVLPAALKGKEVSPFAQFGRDPSSLDGLLTALGIADIPGADLGNSTYKKGRTTYNFDKREVLNWICCCGGLLGKKGQTLIADNIALFLFYRFVVAGEIKDEDALEAAIRKHVEGPDPGISHDLFWLAASGLYRESYEDMIKEAKGLLREYNGDVAEAPFAPETSAPKAAAMVSGGVRGEVAAMAQGEVEVEPISLDGVIDQALERALEVKRKVEPNVKPELTRDEEKLLREAARGVETYLAGILKKEGITQQQYNDKLEAIMLNLAEWYCDPYIVYGDTFDKAKKKFTSTRIGIERAIVDERWEEIASVFEKTISFGTAGFRGNFVFGKKDFDLITEKVKKKKRGLSVPVLKGPYAINNVLAMRFALGIINYFKDQEDKKGKKPSDIKVAIAYDSRIAGVEFAELMRDIALAYGIKVYISDQDMPLPEFSCAIRELKLTFGFFVSASHNAKESNGFKVIGGNGAQIGASEDEREAVKSAIAKASVGEVIEQLRALRGRDIKEAEIIFMGGSEDERVEGVDYGDHEIVDTHKIHREFVKTYIRDKEVLQQFSGDLSVLHCAFYGAGRKSAPRLMRELGVGSVDTIKEMDRPDGAFPALDNAEPSVPDPALTGPWRVALQLYVDQHGEEKLDGEEELAKKSFITAGDPDADRFGLLVRVSAEEIPEDKKAREAMGICWVLSPELQKRYGFGAFRVVTPNEWNALITWYDLMRRQEEAKAKGRREIIDLSKLRIALSHVSTMAMVKIAKKFGFEDSQIVIKPVGIDQLADYIETVESEGQGIEVINAMEESGTYATRGLRDKDGFLAGVRILEIAAWARSQKGRVVGGRRLEEGTLSELLDIISLDPEIGYFVTFNGQVKFKDNPADRERRINIVRWLHKVFMNEVKERADAGNPFIVAGMEVFDADAQDAPLPGRPLGFRSGKYNSDDYKDFPDAGIRFYLRERGSRSKKKTTYITIRPSGTEQKTRFYVHIEVEGITAENLAQRKREIYTNIVNIFEIWKDIADKMDLGLVDDEDRARTKDDAIGDKSTQRPGHMAGLFGTKELQHDEYGIDLHELLNKAIRNTIGHDGRLACTVKVGAEELDVYRIPGLLDEFKRLYRERLEGLKDIELTEVEREGVVALAAMQIIAHPSSYSSKLPEFGGEGLRPSTYMDALYYDALVKAGEESGNRDALFESLAKHELFHINNLGASEAEVHAQAPIDDVKAAMYSRVRLIVQSGGDCAGLNAVVAEFSQRLAPEGLIAVGVIEGFKALVTATLEGVLMPIDAPYAGLLLARPSTDLQSSRENPFAIEENIAKIIDEDTRRKADALFKGLREVENWLLLTDKEEGTLMALREILGKKVVDMFVNTMKNIEPFGGLLITGGDDHSMLAAKFAEFERGRERGRRHSYIAIPKSVDNDAMVKMLGFREAAERLQHRFWTSVVTGAGKFKALVFETMGRKAGWLVLEAARRDKEALKAFLERYPELKEKVSQTGDTIMILVPEENLTISAILERAKAIYEKTGVVNIAVSEGINLKAIRAAEPKLWEELLNKNPYLRTLYEEERETDEHGNESLANLSASEFIISMLHTEWDSGKLRVGLAEEEIRHFIPAYDVRGVNPSEEGIIMAQCYAREAARRMIEIEGETGLIIYYPESVKPEEYATTTPSARPAEEILTIPNRYDREKRDRLPKNLKTLREGSEEYERIASEIENFREEFPPITDEELIEAGVLLKKEDQFLAYDIAEARRVTIGETVLSFREAVQMLRETLMSTGVSGWAHKMANIVEVPDTTGLLTLRVAQRRPAGYENWSARDKGTWEKIRDTILVLLPGREITLEVVAKAVEIYKRHGIVNIVAASSITIGKEGWLYKEIIEKNARLKAKFEETAVETEKGSGLYRVKGISKFIQAALHMTAPEVFKKMKDVRCNQFGEAFYVENLVDYILNKKPEAWEDYPVNDGKDQAVRWMGWLDMAKKFLVKIAAIMEFAHKAKAEGIEHVVVLGTGGSGRAARVLGRFFGIGEEILTVSYSPVAEEIRGILAKVDLRKTLFIVASKSGTTTEPLTQEAIFRAELEKLKMSKAEIREHFVAITDEDTLLHKRQQAGEFREKVFINNKTEDNKKGRDIGGRFSALSFFGLVPLAMAGVNIEELLTQASEEWDNIFDLMIEQKEIDILGVRLAAILEQLRNEGYDHVIQLEEGATGLLGPWIEQLFNESLCKREDAPLWIYGEPFLEGEGHYGKNIIFIRPQINPAVEAGIKVSELNGRPLIEVNFQNLGQLIFDMQIAVTFWGHLLGVNTFTQQSVDVSKDITKRILAAFERCKGPEEVGPILEQEEEKGQTLVRTPEGIEFYFAESKRDELSRTEELIKAQLAERGLTLENATARDMITAFMHATEKGDYVALLPYAGRNDDMMEALGTVRRALKQNLASRPSTLSGFMPGGHHSNNVAFTCKDGAILLITFEGEGIKIPDKPYTTDQLIRAMVVGERDSLEDGVNRELGGAIPIKRRVMVVRMPAEYRNNPELLKALFSVNPVAEVERREGELTVRLSDGTEATASIALVEGVLPTTVAATFNPILKPKGVTLYSRPDAKYVGVNYDTGEASFHAGDFSIYGSSGDIAKLLNKALSKAVAPVQAVAEGPGEISSMTPAEEAPVDFPQLIRSIVTKAIAGTITLVRESPFFKSSPQEVKDIMEERWQEYAATEEAKIVAGNIKRIFSELDEGALREGRELAERHGQIREALDKVLQAAGVPEEGTTVTFRIPTQLYRLDTRLWEKLAEYLNARAGRQDAYIIKQINIPADKVSIETLGADYIAEQIRTQLNGSVRQNTVLYLSDVVAQHLAKHSQLKPLTSGATLVSYSSDIAEKAIFAEGLLAFGEGLRNIRIETLADDIERYGALLNEVYRLTTDETMKLEDFKGSLHKMYSDPRSFLDELLIEFPKIDKVLDNWILEYQRDRVIEAVTELAV
ncbi:MAG: 6-phosphofructokinase [Candidatus Omnitrophica bacterium]|nr:6-phosphofructokinase [Candidatus Omnitrophota bacterium]